MRRTSGSSIVFSRCPRRANGGVPLSTASASELSVRTCRPGKSVVRATISSWARLLNAISVSALPVT